jgi:hypothetical protein
MATDGGNCSQEKAHINVPIPVKDSFKAMIVVQFRTPKGAGSYREVSHGLNFPMPDAITKTSLVSLMCQHTHVGPLAENFTPL